MKAKSIIKSTLIIILVSALVIYMGFTDKNFDYANSAYQVYLDGQSIGIIQNENDFYALINEDQQDIKEEYNVNQVYPPNGFDIVKYLTYSNLYTNASTIYTQIKTGRPFTVKGYTITIKFKDDAGKVTDTKYIYVLDEDVFKDAVLNVVYAFIDEDKFNNYLDNEQDPIVDVGEIIEAMYFDEEITIKESYISTNEKIYEDVNELSQYLLFGTDAEKETYVVKQGDTIETVSYNHQLNTDEFLLANPKFKSETSLLAIGEEVVIALIDPILTFVYETHTVEDEETVFEKKTEYDLTRASSYREITQEGQMGITRVTKKTRVVNGEGSQGVAVINHQVIKDPIPEITTRGKPQSGVYIDNNLAWAWPTNAGYTLSSPYGYRWGVLHDGMDISGTGWGSPIYASLGGVVTWAGSGGPGGSGGGIYVIINHENGYYSVYAHLSKTLVKEGQRVSRGERIALMGNTGSVSPRPTASSPTAGTHLHFGVFIGEPYGGGRSINPMTVFK